MAQPLTDLIANMTVAQLAQATGKSIAEICTLAMANGRSTSSARTTNGARNHEPESTSRPKPKPKTKPKRKAKRTGPPAGFDAQILAAVQQAGGPIRSEHIGIGDPASRRGALARLLDAGKIKRKGNRRATTYEARA